MLIMRFLFRIVKRGMWCGGEEESLPDILALFVFFLYIKCMRPHLVVCDCSCQSFIRWIMRIRWPVAFYSIFCSLPPPIFSYQSAHPHRHHRPCWCGSVFMLFISLRQVSSSFGPASTHSFLHSPLSPRPFVLIAQCHALVGVAVGGSSFPHHASTRVDRFNTRHCFSIDPPAFFLPAFPLAPALTLFSIHHLHIIARS
jgi:hypothetical protein